MKTTTQSIAKKTQNLNFFSSELLLDKDNEAVNRKDLQGILSYLKYLHDKGEINERSYENLVSQVVNIFAENILDIKMKKVFKDIESVS
jgi:hypothetical protein